MFEDNRWMLRKPKDAKFFQDDQRWWMPTYMVSIDPFNGERTVYKWRVLERKWIGWKPGDMWRTDYANE